MEEKAPSTKPSIVPGPMEETVVVQVRLPLGRLSVSAKGDSRSRTRTLAFGVGLTLMLVAVLIEGWGRSFGVLCGALGGAVIVLGLLMKESPNSP